MEEKISFEGLVSGEKFDKEGNLLTEYNKKTEGIIDINKISEKNKVCIDANMMTSAILNLDFKRVLIQNIGKDFPYTTEICRKETIGNIQKDLRINWKEAEEKFEEFGKDISLNFLDFKEEYIEEGYEFFEKVISSGMKIKNLRTFKKDCINVITILRNNVNVFFCNDEELANVCKRFKIKIEFIPISLSDRKIIKEFWKQYPKLKYRKRHQKAKR